MCVQVFARPIRSRVVLIGYTVWIQGNQLVNQLRMDTAPSFQGSIMHADPCSLDYPPAYTPLLSLLKACIGLPFRAPMRKCVPSHALLMEHSCVVFRMTYRNYVALKNRGH